MRRFLDQIKKLKSSKTKLSDIFSFSLGNYRYKLYYFRKYKESYLYIRYIVLFLLLRQHIQDQIEYRIEWMDRECYDRGECKLCGCTTTALQMCNKSCDKPCYPSMMTRSKWKAYKNGSKYIDKHGTWLALLSQRNKPILYNNESVSQMDISSFQEERHIQQDYPSGKY